MSGAAWMNWTLVGGLVICLPTFFLFKESYRRLDIDDGLVVQTIDTEIKSSAGEADRDQLIDPSETI